MNELNNTKNIRNVQINATSPKEDVLSAITGRWSSSIINGWSVIHISDRIELWHIMCEEPGTFLLPRELDSVTIAKIFNTDGTVTCQPILLKQKAINVPKACLVEVMITNI